VQPRLIEPRSRERGLTDDLKHWTIARRRVDSRKVRADVRLSVRVDGVVQGVGFRPFVHGLATRLGLTGHVGNDSAGVFIEVEGPPEAVDGFVASLIEQPPPLALVERVETGALVPLGTKGFAILKSRNQETMRTLVSPDIATCDDCLAELFDPHDRRYRYPFVNCTNCGPRFTIVKDVPYDRHRTTMAAFAMCDQCRREYEDPSDRRFHAQPVCCPACGPRLQLWTTPRSFSTDAPAAHAPAGEDALRHAVGLLHQGQVLAIKGLGGYHLAVDAADEAATRTLRERKHREDRPFAVMVGDALAARELCEVDADAEAILVERSRPIVLLPRLPGAAVAGAVSPRNRRLGVMLPYTPLHHLLLRDFGGPIVLTSGNVSDEPIVHRDDDIGRLSGIADAYVTHDRPSHIRTDDSVVRPFQGHAQVQRRSRGHVPAPVCVPHPFLRPVLACGGELKNTFCLGQDRRAFISHHIGDLENFETLQAFISGIVHFERLFDVQPAVIAHDLHPEYLATKHALALAEADDLPAVAVQHHHAHIASCLADNLETGPVIGVAFDGLGLGTDGTIWGGEFLQADLAGFRRVGHLANVPMPGGVTAIRQPWRMAASYIQATGAECEGLAVTVRHQAEWHRVTAVARSHTGSPWTSSAGRLFDAVAAILDVRDEITYEGQAAVELEQLADPGERSCYQARTQDDDPLVLHTGDLVLACIADLRAGVPRPVIAARFHNGLARLVVSTCLVLREALDLHTVALSGGVFQNLLLLERTVEGLEGERFRVLSHRRVPTNDGGLSLGQAVVAAAVDRDLA
jgi:hydrogenase maturation protein HypF